VGVTEILTAQVVPRSEESIVYWRRHFPPRSHAAAVKNFLSQRAKSMPAPPANEIPVYRVAFSANISDAVALGQKLESAEAKMAVNNS